VWGVLVRRFALSEGLTALTALERLALEPRGPALFCGGAQHLPALRRLAVSAACAVGASLCSASLTSLSLLGIQVHLLKRPTWKNHPIS
jgi:hypothetical protein